MTAVDPEKNKIWKRLCFLRFRLLALSVGFPGGAGLAFVILAIRYRLDPVALSYGAVVFTMSLMVSAIITLYVDSLVDRIIKASDDSIIPGNPNHQNWKQHIGPLAYGMQLKRNWWQRFLNRFTHKEDAINEWVERFNAFCREVDRDRNISLGISAAYKAKEYYESHKQLPPGELLMRMCEAQYRIHVHKMREEKLWKEFKEFKAGSQFFRVPAYEAAAEFIGRVQDWVCYQA